MGQAYTVLEAADKGTVAKKVIANYSVPATVEYMKAASYRDAVFLFRATG